MQAANKNPPWARSAGDNMNNTGMGGAAGMLQYGAAAAAAAGGLYSQGVMQNAGGNMLGMQGGMQMGQMYPTNVVAYPTPRAMNTGGFPAQAQPASTEQRVFTGTVTKTHNDFGFVDHDVFYQTSVCAKGVLPKVNDRVLVEATYNANMPFKWNATRVQVLSKTTQSGGSGYNAVPPPSRDNDRFRKSNTSRRDERSPPRRSLPKRARSRSKSPVRSKRRDSPQPPRKRVTRRSPTPVAKYIVRVPRMPLNVSELDVTSMTHRYNTLYIPSDFFHANVKWSEAFPPQCNFQLHNPCQFHVMSKEVANPVPNNAVLEPPDADYSFSAKVMLISLPTLESLYQKCGLTKSDSKERREKSTLHPTRLIKFLVGNKGKTGESFAIGGPWSPSLDGPNPDSDPTVLVKTAIRTTKALTGIDLTPCTQWFRMVEFYYWREGAAGGKGRLETVVLFLPDVWSAMPSEADWTNLQDVYKKALEKELNPAAAQAEKIDESMNESSESVDEPTTNDNQEEGAKKEPTHYSQLDLKTIKVEQLREELKARAQNNKGIRAQLLSRLSKLLKTEEEEEKKKKEEEEDKKKEDEKKKEETKGKEEDSDIVEISDDLTKDNTVDEKKAASLKSQYSLPSSPCLIVHPSSTARGGKFNCSVSTLSVLLDYRSTDNKEHSFEIFVFAELFNEMLQRDFGFYIYKTVYTLPEKEEEKKDGKKDEEKKDGKKDEEKKEGKKDDNKKDEKEEDKKEEDKKDEEKKEEEAKEKEKEKKRSRSVESEANRHVSRGVELPADPYLLLSLVYFDTGRCGYLHNRDLTTLFMSLGLQLSRSQLKHILNKICVKEQFNYKSLMTQIRDASSKPADVLANLPLDSATNDKITPAVLELEACIASGNRDLLPVFGDDPDKSNTGNVPDSGMVMYKSRLVDIGATLSALSRSERTCGALDSALADTRAALRAARLECDQRAITARGLQAQLANTAGLLTAANNNVNSLTVKLKLFQSSLKAIQSQVEGVVNIDIECKPTVNGPDVKENESKKEEVEPKDEVKEENESKPLKEEPASEDKCAEVKPAEEEPVKEETDKKDSTDQLQPENMDIDEK